MIGGAPAVPATSGRRASAIVAMAFAWFVNQGVVYYVARFTVGVETLSPWPLFAITVAATAVALASRGMDERFVRVAYASVVLNSLYAATYAWSPSLDYGMQKTLLTLFMPTMCIAAGYVVARDGYLHLLLTSYAVLAGIMGAVFTANGHTPAMFAEVERPREVIITYHNFSFVMAFGAIWAIDRFARRLPKVDIWAIACFGTFTYFILLSGGRIGLLLVILSVFIAAWTRSKDRLLAAILVLAFICLCVVAILIIQAHAYEINNSNAVPTTIKRMVYYAFIQRAGEPSSNTRDIYYNHAVLVFLKAPLFGVGWGGFPVSAGFPDVSGQWPHNLPLELLSETGIAGAAAFLVFMTPPLYYFYLSKHVADGEILLLVFIAGLGTSMIGGDWPSQRVLFFAIGAMTGLAAGAARRSDGAAASAAAQAHHPADGYLADGRRGQLATAPRPSGRQARFRLDGRHERRG